MQEVRRKVSYVSITEEGLYHDGEIPSDYNGPVINFEVAHSIVFAEETTGNLLTLNCSVPPAKNANRIETPYAHSSMVIREPSVSETDGSEGDEYSHKYPQRLQDRVTHMIDFLEQQGSKVLPGI